MILKNKIIGLLSLTLCTAMFTVSCNKDGDDTLIKKKNLSINVRMNDEAWLTRGYNSQNTSDTVGIDDKLELIVESSSQEFAEAPLTRGTPIASTSGLKNIVISFSPKNAGSYTKIIANNNNNSWQLASNISIIEDNEYDYYAYSPQDISNTNGITYNNLSITYVVPTTVANQPDLCYSTPILGSSASPSFVLKHALTAVGVMVSADNVEIESISFTANTKGILNIKTGAWGNLSTMGTINSTLTTTKPGTNSEMNNITANNGYLMFPPQTLQDAHQLKIKYKYNGESTFKTSTHILKNLGITSWVAGQKLMYKIQLKANFSLNIPITTGNVGDLGTQTTTASFAFTTNNPSTSNENKPTATANASWITDIEVNHAAGVGGTISFKCAANPTSLSRSAIFTVTSGFTSRTYTLTQVKNLEISLSSKRPYSTDTERIPSIGATFLTNVIVPAGVPWKASPSNNNSRITIVPSSGVGPVNNVQIKIAMNPTTTKIENTQIDFMTTAIDVANKSVSWAGTQYPTIETVLIGTTKWFTRNLTGEIDNNNTHGQTDSPELNKMFFKWGQTRVYSGTIPSSGWNSDGNWTSTTSGSSSTPATSVSNKLGYDYVGLTGVLPGDPCQKVGPKYRIPTRAQISELLEAKKNNSQYKDVKGVFFGPNASKCNNSTIAPGCIFLPAGGQRIYSGGALSYGNNLYYWSSTVFDSEKAYCLYAQDATHSNIAYARASGLMVRCIEMP